MKIPLHERHNHSESSITVKVSRRNLKNKIYLVDERYGLKIFSSDLGHSFGSNVGDEFGVMLNEKGPHKPEIAFDIVRLYSFKI